MKILLSLLLCIAVTATIQIHAQTFKVSGIVKDADNAPVEFANVELKNGNPDNVTGTTTDAIDITVDKDMDLGVIQLKQEAQLKEVTVYAPKTLVVRKVDRLAFNVENSVAATGGDALDALKLTPGVQVRNDNVCDITLCFPFYLNRLFPTIYRNMILG